MSNSSESPNTASGGAESGQAQDQAQTQSQNQSQTQSIEISVGSAGDPELESRIFRSVHSVGRQLSRISNAMSVLIERLELDPELPKVAAPVRALSDFRQMRADISKELKERDDRLVASLEKIRQEDPVRYATLAPRLRELLDAEPGATADDPASRSRP